MRKTGFLLGALALAALVMPIGAAVRAEPSLFTESVAFTTKTGFRGVFTWEATKPVAPMVHYGTTPATTTLVIPPGPPDTAGVVTVDGLVPGTTYYWKVRDQITGESTAVSSFVADNAYKDWNGSIYTIDLILQLDSESLPPDLPGDLALQDIAAGVNVFAERVYDALDGYARIGNVLITDSNVDYAANVPFASAPVCGDVNNIADILVETVPPLDSHTFSGYAINQACTSFYIGRLGWLGSHWLDDLSLGYVMAHEGMHYVFNTPDLYDGPDCRNLAWDGSIMHNTGGWNGSRWELSELDRNPTLTPCDHGTAPWSWDALRVRYTNVPLNPAGPIDHMVDTLPRGNADGGALNIMILDREPGSSTLTPYTPDDSFEPFTPGTQMKHYVGGWGDALVSCGGWMNPGIGGACFDLQGGETGATITIDDEAGWDVGAQYQFRDAADDVVDSGFICGGASLPVPAGSIELLLFLGEATAPAECVLAGGFSPGAATTGTITVSFAPPPPPPPGVQTKSYIGGIGDAAATCGNPGLGGTCFNLVGGETGATITIDDQATWDTGAFYRFENAGGDELSSDFMCGSAAVAVPTGATQLWVFVGEATGPAQCFIAGDVSPGAGTAGTITVAFT